ncbi:hypothetical protein OROGR_022600 [Orobanche gracilis]
MEIDTCDVNHLDADALLPPRKRLLAGRKKQVPDIHFPAQFTGSQCDIRLDNLLRYHLSNPNISNEEIAQASKCAAIKAAKAAEAKRANAEQKAAKAAKAVAAAKNALKLVASIEEEAAEKEKCQKKNKMKKHVPVEELYNTKRGNNTNFRKDEEMARSLHRAINSSPRILRSSPGSGSKNHKLKKLKISGVYSAEGNVKETDKITVDLNSSKCDKVDKVAVDNGEGKSSRLDSENDEVGVISKDKFSEPLDSFSRKRGRIKQKKLPLSICSFRDQTSPKDEAKASGRSVNGLVPPAGRTLISKCQEFRAPACVSQNKVMQS